MVRRFFVSTFSSVVAVTASTLYSTGVANAQSAPAQPRSGMSFLEPEPIVVGQATADRARGLLDAVTRGKFDRSELMPQLDAFVGPNAFPFGARLLSALGPRNRCIRSKSASWLTKSGRSFACAIRRTS